VNSGRGRVALVSEVLDRLLAEYGSESPRRSVLFQAAMQVCAEESKRVKRGHQPVPLEVLVERARDILASPAARYELTPSSPIVPPSDPAPPPFEAPQPQEEATFGEVAPASSSAALGEGSRGALDPPQRRRRSSLAALLAALGPVLLAAVLVYLYLGPRLGLRERSSAERVLPLAVGTRGPEAPTVGEAATAVPAGPTDRAAALAPPPPPEEPATTTPSPPPLSGQPPGGVTAEGVETMVSRDWDGRIATFVIHFSSYRERGKAQRDAAALARRYRRPAYAAEVSLPNGAWYRVILGDFPTAAAARTFRDALLEAHTPEVGGVYRVTAP
jgi:hypothetical protein